ncbi:prepilin-type N-terminal cleavage/methylation domain-containing protein [Paenibacillus sinopodophylli]|uniref:prepilin-type N-terminal cleavage/methylation domain-containing protein n=1 Tax=Paenibacillus sinopodophylli TaxID=1837342 RepID=UPI00110D1629|nr:prepilin-type N-terminal cleavage/methylation domain-containing protein [Paenibacillus sinopodophylli]
MPKWLKNEKGLTLVEVTGVLVLTAIILGFLIYLLSYSNTSLQQVSGREKTMQQSRDIVTQVVKTVRDGYTPATYPSKTSSLRLLSADNDEAVDYSYNSAGKSLTVTYTPRDANGHDAASPTSKYTFSDKIENILFDVKDGRSIEITLTMLLPNNQTKTTTTVVYTTQRNP